MPRSPHDSANAGSRSAATPGNFAGASLNHNSRPPPLVISRTAVVESGAPLSPDIFASRSDFIYNLLYLAFITTVFTGTLAAYSTIFPGVVCFFNDPEKLDKDLYAQAFLAPLPLAVFAAIKETDLYWKFAQRHFRFLKETEFVRWVQHLIPRDSPAYNRFCGICKSILGGASFAVTAGHMSSHHDATYTTQRWIAGVGFAAGMALYWQGTQGFYHTPRPKPRRISVDPTQQTAEFNNFTTLASSFFISFPSVANYAVSVLNLLRAADISQETRYEMEQALIAFCICTLYYYVRMYYEGEVEKAYEDNPTVRSYFGRLENFLQESYFSHTNAHTQSYLTPILRRLHQLCRGLITGGIVSGGLLYCMWTAWRAIAINLRWIPHEEISVSPQANWFDLTTIFVLTTANFLARFARFDQTANFMQHNLDLFDPTNHHALLSNGRLDASTPLLQSLGTFDSDEQLVSAAHARPLSDQDFAEATRLSSEARKLLHQYLGKRLVVYEDARQELQTILLTWGQPLARELRFAFYEGILGAVGEIIRSSVDPQLKSDFLIPLESWLREQSTAVSNKESPAGSRHASASLGKQRPRLGAFAPPAAQAASAASGEAFLPLTDKTAFAIKKIREATIETSNFTPVIKNLQVIFSELVAGSSKQDRNDFYNALLNTVERLYEDRRISANIKENFLKKLSVQLQRDRDFSYLFYNPVSYL